ncbi:MAG: hypothetical protein M5U11_00565 [Anaerolineales bacterium]|nr:hypothetical protein [Anaerolineales bacterium]
MQTYNQRIYQYIEKYSSLVKYAEELAFPSDRKGLPEKAREWGRLRKAIHRMAHPFTIAENTFWDYVGYFILVFLMQTNLGWGLMLLSPALLSSPAILSFENIGSAISLILALIFSIPLAAVSYYWFFDIFTDRATHPKSPYILATIDLIFILSFSFAVRSGSGSKDLTVSSVNIIPFLVSYILFFVPVITYFLIICSEAVALFRQIILSVSRSVKTIHDPLPLGQVRTLAIEEIPALENKPGWKLSSLSLHEIQTLRTWAEANLEATDKRTLPAVFVFGFLALFLSSDTIKQSIVEPVTTFWWNELTFFWTFTKDSPSKLLSWDFLLSVLMLAITLILTKYILRTFSRLFRNFPVQSLVVEACVLAESAHEENNRDDKSNISPLSNPLLRFLRDVIELIFRLKHP